MKPVLPSRSVTGMPAGTMMASTSRCRVTGSCSCLYTVGLRRLFGCDGRRGALERGVQRVPAEARAFDARRKLAHAGERREFAELRGIDLRVVLRQYCMDFVAQLLHLGARFAFHCFGQQRRRRDRDRAAAALELRLADTL